MKVLYAWDFSGVKPMDLIQYIRSEEEYKVSEPDEFFSELVDGVIRYREMLDEIISDYATEWDFDRISVVDRNILRIALYEIMFVEDNPFAVIVDEAISIAKIYGSENSYRFINGVLDKAKGEHDDRSNHRWRSDSVVDPEFR